MIILKKLYIFIEKRRTTSYEMALLFSSLKVRLVMGRTRVTVINLLVVLEGVRHPPLAGEVLRLARRARSRVLAQRRGLRPRTAQHRAQSDRAQRAEYRFNHPPP